MTETSQKLPVGADTVIWECFRHFAHLDHANAAIHTSPVRYSPLTFRLAELLDGVQPHLANENEMLLNEVLRHRSQYEEDTGR